MVTIAVRYDILLIQEIRDNTGEAIQQLLQRIREEDHGIKVLKKYVYKEESGTDPFEREPYIVQFRASNCVGQI
nr:hypothetical protein BaRGS_031918 [Batillaria attramentaria]